MTDPAALIAQLPAHAQEWFIRQWNEATNYYQQEDVRERVELTLAFYRLNVWDEGTQRWLPAEPPHLVS